MKAITKGEQAADGTVGGLPGSGKYLLVYNSTPVPGTGTGAAIFSRFLPLCNQDVRRILPLPAQDLGPSNQLMKQYLDRDKCPKKPT